MALKKIEERTYHFNELVSLLKKRGLIKNNQQLAKALGINVVSTITEIKNLRQNIQPEVWEKFKEVYSPYFPDNTEKFVFKQPNERQSNPFGTMEIAEERALIRVILDELAHLKSKVQPGVSYEDAKEELRRKTNLVLEAMKGA